MTTPTAANAVEALPLLPGHPEPHTYRWTDLEVAAIRDYGQRCYRAALAAAQAKPILLTGAQLIEAAEFIVPDRADQDQLESEARLQFGAGHSGEGWYISFDEMPEEGSMLLDGSTVATPPQPPSPDVERQARSPEQLMAEVDALKVDMTAQMRCDSGRAALEDRQAVGYVSPHGLEELRKGGSQTINTVASAKYTVPLFATPPQEAGDADAERLSNALSLTKKALEDVQYEVMQYAEGFDLLWQQVDEALDAARLAMEERKT